MRFIFFLVFFFILISFPAQVWKAPARYQLLAEATGDLDADSLAERVYVYDTGDTVEYGTARTVVILKANGTAWKLWLRSDAAVLASEAGGVMGDPFAGIEIKKRCLIISHYGGSSWKWSLTDQYRFQNKRLQLIGFTSYSGKPCEEWKTVDYNLSTGNIEAKREFESCNDTTDDVKITKTIKENWKDEKRVLYFESRYNKEIQFTSPKKLFEVHL